MYVCWRVEVHCCCFTSTETIKTVRDREHRTDTSTSTQLLSSVTAVYIYTVYTDPYLYESLVQTLKLFLLRGISFEVFTCCGLAERRPTPGRAPSQERCRRAVHTSSFPVLQSWGPQGGGNWWK